MITTARVYEILQSENRLYADLPHKDCSINDALSFGFSYIEYQDHIVESVVASPKIVRKIFKEIDDATIEPENQSIGKIWTASLIVSKKISDKYIVFSNGGHTSILFLRINTNKI